MTLRREAKCPFCGVVALCEWRFKMSPYMCNDHAGWFCLNCLKRIETTSMGQHFMADLTVYTSVEKAGALSNPYNKKRIEYMKFVKHKIVGMPEEVTIICDGCIAEGDDLIDVEAG
jgi:hypothetical protein